MREPAVAVALLQLCCRDEALVGDILEEFDRRQSRTWLWRQVAAAVVFGLPYGMVRRGGQTRKMPMPIGGLGLIVTVALITIVSPGTWWLGVVGVAGGLVIAVALAMVRRRRVLRESAEPRHILL